MAAQRYYTYSFAANQQIRVHQSGTFFRCVAGSALFTVATDEENELQVQEGIGARYQDPFKSLRITNGSTAQTITLYVGDGNVDDARSYGAISAKEGAFDDMTCADDATLDATEEDTIAARANRAITIQADINNSTNLRAGPSDTVDDTNGTIFIPGSSYTFYTTRAIKVRNPTGGDNAQGYRYWYEHD